MKITGNNEFGNVYNRKLNSANNSAKSGKANFASMMESTATDSITISRNKEMDDDAFIRALGSKISSEVKAGASAGTVNDVKQQIALGQYDININEIARKILG